MKLEDKLLENLKSECQYVCATEESLKHSRLFNTYYELDEDAQHDYEVSQNIKDYLESVLGVTFVWSEDKQDWIKEII